MHRCFQVHANAHEPRTHEEQESALEWIRSSFPDLDAEIHESIAIEDRVALFWSGIGTHEGEFEGIPPTNDEIEIRIISIFRIESDKLAESWHVMDFHGLMGQVRPDDGETHRKGGG
ncbi:MAG: ester cyclase [Halobacteriaceae archaeon]